MTLVIQQFTAKEIINATSIDFGYMDNDNKPLSAMIIDPRC